jgi:hypothetical protein
MIMDCESKKQVSENGRTQDGSKWKKTGYCGTTRGRQKLNWMPRDGLFCIFNPLQPTVAQHERWANHMRE